MHCEVCGRPIQGKPYRALIEGAKMLVCMGCAKLSSTYGEVKLKPPHHATPTIARRMVKVKFEEEETALVDDYSKQIRQAREKMGLTHEDLGRKLNEKVSVLQKIETGKLIPDQRLIRKLECTLKIKLLTSLTELPLTPSVGSPPLKLTLEDVAKIKKHERKEEKA